MKKRRYILRHILNCVNKNGGKLLNWEHSKGCYFFKERDRQEQTTYYLTTVKGNFIRSYTLRYVLKNGESINTFIGLTIPGLIGQEEIEIPTLEKKMILKIKFSEYRSFESIYRNLTPFLDWRDFKMANWFNKNNPAKPDENSFCVFIDSNKKIRKGRYLINSSNEGYFKTEDNKEINFDKHVKAWTYEYEFIDEAINFAGENKK